MAVRIIEPIDSIEIDVLPILIFGPPGCWKTSLSQTAHGPLTLDMDEGIHRAFNRKRAARFDTWADVETATRDGTFTPYKTLVVDTLGRLLDKIIPYVRQANPKNCGPGGLSPQGWGVLGNTFAAWIKTIREMKKDLVLICHEKDGTDATGNGFVQPDMPGKMSWGELHKWTEVIGRIRYDGNRRILDFNPSEGATCCKNAARWDAVELPNFAVATTFLGDLIVDAKTKIGKTAEASALIARAVEEHRIRIAGCEDANCLNILFAGLPHDMPRAAKAQVWTLILNRSKEVGAVWDVANKTFRSPAPVQREPGVEPGESEAA